tara:strand:+ start:222 stop:1040 length:819 start_codon:yes stop_codon:yes gene_type:complete
MNKYIIIFLFFFQLFFFKVLYSKEDFILIQSTTSTRDSGFYDFILSKYKEVSNVNIKVVASGTGHAIQNAKKCDADIILVHDKSSEELFVRNGFGLYRKDLMYNDFLLVGPKILKNKIQNNDIYDAFKEIYKKKFFFISRGDNSGTHKKESSLWKDLNLEIDPRKDFWFLETGSGMGSSLNVAVNKNAFILTDRATWLSFNNKRDHVVIVERDNNLFNYYGIIPINPEKCPNSKIELSEKFINWLLSDYGQALINSFERNGEQLFFGNYKKN